MNRSSVGGGLIVIVACVFVRCHKDIVDEPKPSKVERTGAKVQRYFSEAFPAWTREHPGKACPDTVDELNKYIGSSDSKDAWGRPLKLQCGPRLPNGLQVSPHVVSAGEDGKFDTYDDVVPF